MSLRSATRVTRSLRATNLIHRAPLVARRAASSGGAHKAPGSDLPWVLGSAAVFLPLGAWVTFRGGDEHHEDHGHGSHAKDQNTAEGPVDQYGTSGVESGHVNEEDKTDEPSGSDEETGSAHAAASNTGTPKKELSDDKEAVKNQTAQGTRPDPPSEAKQAEDKASKPKGDDKEEKSDEKSEDKKEKSDDKKEKSDDKQDDGDNGDEPSAQDIKDSLTRAEKTNVPRVAMDEEAKGNQTQAEADKA